jgi:NAD(P)-dependent dehydrogenase (short-subunit alcohol dehydrogenase family)
MTDRLKDKVAIITGAARGIGEGHADLFAAEGAAVVVTDVLESDGEAVAARIRGRGQKAIFQKLDVSDRDSWAATIEATLAEFGAITTLVNNAAVFNPSGLEKTTLDGWDKVIAVNLTGTFLGMQAVMPHLRASGNGSIVNVCSLYGLVATHGFTSYHASKGGMRMLSKAAALEYAKQGVRINSVYPGDTATPAQDNLTAEERAQVLSQVPMGYEAESIDIAFGSLYLASDEARYLTGAEIVIDGGWSLP